VMYTGKELLAVFAAVAAAVLINVIVEEKA
jgi:hypothetical protein